MSPIIRASPRRIQALEIALSGRLAPMRRGIYRGTSSLGYDSSSELWAHGAHPPRWRQGGSVGQMAILLLILLTESLDIRLAVGIEEFLTALLPSCLEFGSSDIP